MSRLLVAKEINPLSIEDQWYKVAYNIETFLINAGAKEGDYTLVDLYSLAQSHVLENIKEINKENAILVYPNPS